MTKQKPQAAAEETRHTMGQLLAVAAAAKELGVSSVTVVRACESHDLPIVRAGLGKARKRLFVTRETLDALKQLQAGTIAD